MQRIRRLQCLVVALALALAGCHASAPPATGTTAPQPATGASGAGAAPVTAADSAAQTAQQRQRAVAAMMTRIAGKEQQPAESVFKNIKMMKGVPAARLLRIMDMGFGRSLGVGCQHCHVPRQWESDDKPTKQIAREMMKMVQQINTQILPSIQNLKGTPPTVNCTTCHRGSVKPVLDMGPA